MFWLGFILGVVVGTCLGALLIALLTAAAIVDTQADHFPYHQPDESKQS